MGVDTIEQTGPARRLFELYTRYVGEPDSTMHVYGYTLLVVGYLLAMAGVAVFVLGPSRGTTALAYFVQQVAIVPAAVGMVATLFGIVLTLPVRRRGTLTAVVGALLCLVAVAWFTVVYPENWTRGTPTFSAQVITLYSVGLALVAGVVVMVPVVTGERSYFSETAEGHEYDHPAIMVGETDRGGLFAVFKRGTDWTWRLIDQRAIAASADSFLSRLEAESRVEAVKDQVADAGLIEIKHTAFRLYRTAGDVWQWYLMSDDGSVLAESGDEYEDRDGAESAINAMKDFGADADLFVLEEAGFDCQRQGEGWTWRLVDEERAPLAESPATYTDRDAAVSALEEVRSVAERAETLAIDSFGVELVPTEGAWDWYLRDERGRRIAHNRPSHDTKGSAEDRVYDLLESVPDAAVLTAGRPTYDLYLHGEDWRWRLVDGAGAHVAAGTDGFESAAGSRDVALAARDAIEDADVVEVADREFETYRAGDGWRWRLVTADREVLAASSGSYDSETAAEESVERVRREAPSADLIEFDTAAFQVYETADGSWRWRLIDEDGTVLADSGQGEYDSKDGAMGAMTTLQEHAPEAEHLEIESAAFELFEDDAGWGWRFVDDIGDTIAESESRHDTEADAREAMDGLAGTVESVDGRSLSSGLFQVYDADEDWWWRLVLPDGRVVAEAPEHFGTRHAAEDAVAELRTFAADAPVERLGSLAFLVDPEDWHWELVDGDRERVAVGSVEHGDREAVESAIESFQQAADRTTVYTVEEGLFDCYRDGSAWTWRLVDADHDELARSPGGHETRDGALEAASTVRTLAPEADLIDYDDVAFELSADETGWVWRFVDEDGRVIAAGAHRYEDRSDAEEELLAVRDHIADASVIEIDSAAFEFHRTEEGWRWRLVDEAGTELAGSVAAFETRAEAQEELSTVKEFAPESWVSVAE